VNYKLAFLVIFSFIFIAVFGFLAMNHTSGHKHFGCIAALSRAADCPQGSAGLLDFAIFHINAFKNFSTVVFAENFSATFLICYWLLFIALMAAGRGVGPTDSKSDFSFYYLRFQRVFGPPLKRKLISWISLHENSPTHF
jgi:hypothetical protein